MSLEIRLNGNTIDFKPNECGNNPVVVNFCNTSRVHDEIRGYLVYQNRCWNFVGVTQYNYLRKTKKEKIALILESPHIDEYSANYVPLRPANGKTGMNINKKIAINYAQKWNLNISYDYEVKLFNPVQFQCSCNYFFTNSKYNISNYLSRDLTRKVFRSLFNAKKGRQRQDFITRLTAYNPMIVVNASTSSLKPVVKNAIIKNNINYYEEFHPSVW